MFQSVFHCRRHGCLMRIAIDLEKITLNRSIRCVNDKEC